MGRAFYRYKEAAARLGCSTRSVYNYARRGLIRKFKVEGDVVLDRNDVEQLAQAQGTDFPAMNRAAYLDLQRRMKKVEEEMVTVKHILEIRDDPLRLKPKEAETFFNAATDSMTRVNKWIFDEVKLWAEQLEKMDELTLEAIAAATMKSDSWVPFFRLCSAMQEYAAAQFERQPDIKWQAVHKKLEEARTKIRGVVVVWLEAGRGHLPDTFLRALEDPKTSLFRSLTKPPSKSS